MRAGSAGRPDLPELERDVFQRAHDLADRLGGDAGIERRGDELRVTRAVMIYTEPRLTHRSQSRAAWHLRQRRPPTPSLGEACQSSARLPKARPRKPSAFDLAVAEHMQRRHVADADEFCCCFERSRRAPPHSPSWNTAMSWRLRKRRTCSCVQALPCPVSTPVAIEQARYLPIGHQPCQLMHPCMIVSLGMRGLCRRAAFSRCVPCTWVWSPPCQCRTAWTIVLSLRTTISASAA